MLRKIVGVLSVLVIGGAIVLFFALERVNTEHLDMDAAARVHAPGLFVELSDGVTHYDEAGPASRQTVILIHGFSVPYYIWDTTYVALVEGEVGDRVGAQLRAGVDLDDEAAYQQWCDELTRMPTRWIEAAVVHYCDLNGLELKPRK